MAPLPFLRLSLLLALLRPTVHTQQVGSFFTAIYLNGAVVSSSQTSCADMGQSQYCCGSGSSCAWDDAGKVACCAQGQTCQGGAYGSGAAAGGAGGWSATSQAAWQPTTSPWQPQPTSTVYNQAGYGPGQGQRSDCQCDGTTTTTQYNNNGGGAVVPIVPVTKATILTSYTPAPATTTTYAQYPTTTTVVPVQGNVATSRGACAGGVYSVSFGRFSAVVFDCSTATFMSISIDHLSC